MYIRIADKNPMKDVSVPGWAPNSVIIQNAAKYDNEGKIIIDGIIDGIEENGLVVEFTQDELETALQQGTVDSLPQIHAGSVCCFETDSIEDWLNDCVPDLERMGYDINDPNLRIWQVWGEEKDVADFEGTYVVPEKSEDITEKIRR